MLHETNLYHEPGNAPYVLPCEALFLKPNLKADGFVSLYTAMDALPPCYQQGEWCAMWNWKQSWDRSIKVTFQWHVKQWHICGRIQPLMGFSKNGDGGLWLSAPNVNIYSVETSAPAGIQSQNNQPVKGLNPGSWTSWVPALTTEVLGSSGSHFFHKIQFADRLCTSKCKV